MRDPEAERFLGRLDDEERYETWHLAFPDGSLTGRGAGGVELLRAMRLTRSSSRVLALVPERVLDGAYELVARNRRRLGRLVPDGPAPRRAP